MTFVKQWNASKGLKWSDAVKQAKDDYYIQKESKTETVYKKNKGSKGIFNYLKKQGLDTTNLIFKPSNKKFDKNIYLVEAEELEKDDYDKLVEKAKNAKFKKAAKKLMNIPEAYIEPRAKIRKRPIGIRQVSKIKKKVEKATTKIKDKKKVRALQQQILSLNRMKGLKKILNK